MFVSAFLQTVKIKYHTVNKCKHLFIAELVTPCAILVFAFNFPRTQRKIWSWQGDVAQLKFK